MAHVSATVFHRTKLPDRVFAQLTGVEVHPTQVEEGEFFVLELELAFLDGRYHGETSRLLLPRELARSIRDDIENLL